MTEELLEERSALDWRADPLWHSLRAMRIGPTDAALTFEQRLARENGWGDLRALEVDQEYRRFLYLAARVREPMTPSVAVDQAWHLHLSYTRHYWDVLCGQILEQPLHHDPTEGGPAEFDRFHHQYERTLAAYTAVFGSEPPPAIWPDADARFASQMCAVDRTRTWLVPKASIVRTAPALCLAIALSIWAVVGNLSLGQIAIWIVYFGVISLVMASVHRRKRREGENFEFEWPDFGGESGCGGGCGGCGG
jgi:hypothetical protein